MRSRDQHPGLQWAAGGSSPKELYIVSVHVRSERISVKLTPSDGLATVRESNKCVLSGTDVERSQV